MSKLKEYLKDPFYNLKSTYNLVLCAMLIALGTVCSIIFSMYIDTSNKLSLTVIFIMLIAAKFGPVIAGFSAAMIDVIQYLAKPIGPFLPWLTLTAALGGVIYGITLYNKKTTLLRIIISRAIVVIFISLLLDTYLISILYGKIYIPMLISRGITRAVLFPIEIILTQASFFTINKIENRKTK